jgi:exosortase A
MSLAAMLVVLLVAMHRTGLDMVTIWWRSATFTHAFVVPPIVAWLIWRARARVWALTPEPAPLALVPMALAALLWLLGEFTSTAAASQFAFTAMLVLCVPLLLGWSVTRVLLFPLLFLFFAVPIGEFMTPLLMRWTADVLVASLRLTGIPVYQEGQQLVIPSGRWAVVEACSGIRYLMATFMVGCLFAYLNFQSPKRRFIFVAVALVMPVVANWVRAYIIVMLGHLSNNEIATGVDHLVYGWIFFGIVIMALFFIGARWAEDPPDDTASTDSAGAPQAAWAVGRGAAFVVLGLAAALWPMWVLHARGDSEAAAAAVQLQLPTQLGAWTSVGEPPLSDYLPHFVTPRAEVNRTYRHAGEAVTVHVAYYRGRSGDGKLVSSINQWALTTDQRWHVFSESLQQAPIDGRAQVWREAVLLPQVGMLPSAEQKRIVVWRVYWLGDRLEYSDMSTRLWQAWAALLGRPADGAAVHVITAAADDAQARQLLAGFVRDNFSMLRGTLQAASGRH